MILAATHVHLDDHYCLEVIIMKGRTKEIQGVADRMLALRGVELGKLVLTIRSSSRPCTFMVVPKALTTRDAQRGRGSGGPDGKGHFFGFKIGIGNDESIITWRESRNNEGTTPVRPCRALRE
jgi:NikR C terminal nickel binding domain